MNKIVKDFESFVNEDFTENILYPMDLSEILNDRFEEFQDHLKQFRMYLTKEDDKVCILSVYIDNKIIIAGFDILNFALTTKGFLNTYTAQQFPNIAEIFKVFIETFNTGK